VDTDDILDTTGHRPWPLPSARWIMFQSWRRLLFAHWRVPADGLRALVPPELDIEEFDGSAWVGLTPFVLSGLRLHGLPAVPGASEFPEMNLRTYVRVADRPGIHFFSLDADSRLAVSAARAVYRLPYRAADMEAAEQDGWTVYRSRHSGDGAEFSARYRPTGPPFRPEPGTLEHFLTERYALFVVLEDGTVLRGDVHHRPWTLHVAEAQIERNTVAAAQQIALPDAPPLLHFSARQDVLVWAPAIVG